MLTEVNPKLPMRNKAVTKDFYCNQLGFKVFGSEDFEGYLMVQRDNVQLHFFEHRQLNPSENYGQIYIRTNAIDAFYEELISRNVAIHPNGALQLKPWGMKEFSLLDPDNNLLTVGESV